jgi:hypothetical protein
MFLRLPGDGDAAKVIFAGCPVPYHTWFNEETKQSEVYTPDHEAKGLPRSTKFRINVYNIEVDRMQIWDMTSRALTSLINLKKKGHTNKYAVDITRFGTGKETSYTLAIAPDVPITDEIRAKVGRPEKPAQWDHDGWMEGSVPLLDLTGKRQAPAEHVRKYASVANPEDDGRCDDDALDATMGPQKAADGPIAKTDLDAIVARLREVPRPEGVDKVLKQFRVTRLSLIPASKTAELSAFVTSLLNPGSDATGDLEEEEQDPFA